MSEPTNEPTFWQVGHTYEHKSTGTTITVIRVFRAGTDTVIGYESDRGVGQFTARLVNATNYVDQADEPTNEPTEPTIEVTNPTGGDDSWAPWAGLTFQVRLVRAGNASTGRPRYTPRTDELEVWRRQDDTGNSWFVSSYRVETFAKVKKGLALVGRQLPYTLSADAVREVQAWLETIGADDRADDDETDDDGPFYAANLAAMLADIYNRSPYQLSGQADCATPDNADSLGAEMLLGVARSIVESVRWDIEQLDDDSDAAHDAADNAPSVYTHPMWRQFVDLAAWQEELDEYGTPDDMEQGARWCLYAIARRLAEALLEELREARDEDAETCGCDVDRLTLDESARRVGVE